MGDDNDINELLERDGYRPRTPFLRSSWERDSLEAGHSHTSHSKHRYHSSGRKSIKLTSTIESYTTSQGVHNLRGSNKVTSGNSEAASIDNQQKRIRRSEQARSKRRHMINGVTVPIADDNDDEEEEVVVLRHQTRRTSPPHSFKTSDYSSDEGRRTYTMEGTAYPIYKKAGEWWNVFPKTDYTYSPISPDRKEIVPGIIPMPNMSRRSIHSSAGSNEQHSSSFATNKRSISHATDTRASWFGETFSGTLAKRKLDLTDLDSDVDEVDLPYTSRSSTKSTFILTRIFTSIWTFLSNLTTSIVQTTSHIFNMNGSLSPPRRVTDMSHSWFQKLNIFQYCSVCYVLLLDVWLLKYFRRNRTQLEEIEEHKPDRKYYALLLIPPLILAGWWWFSYAPVEAPVNSIMTIVDTTSTDMKSLLWWLFSPLSSIWATENIVTSSRKSLTLDASSEHEYKVNLDLLAQKILANEQFQNLILSQELRRDKERKQPEQELLSALLLQKETLKQELDQKSELLSKQQELHAQLSGEVVHMKQQIENLEIKLQIAREVPVVDSSQLWRREVRRLEEQIRLLQVSHSNRPCCKPTPLPLPTVAIEEHIIKFLSGLFNSDGEAEGKIPGIQTWIGKLFVAKDDLEAKLANITSSINLKVGEASRRSAQAIMATVSDQIKHEYLKQQANLSAKLSVENRNWALPVATSLTENCSLTVSQVQDIVNNALNTYDADKTGMVDYALESSGGSVINTRCTETYNAKTATVTVLGVSLWWPSNNPRIVIQPGANPGECWAFRGAQGFLVIRLSGRVKISAFSLEHIPLSLAPNGKIDSAPKDFSVWGLQHEDDTDPVMLGKYMYRHNGTSLQIFSVQRSDLQPFEIVELKVESNHGNMEYTCLYRFRVHGVLTPK